jgi:hypothetical protein
MGAHGQEPMKVFKTRSMMQEHRPRQASQHGRQRIAGQGQPKFFEFSYKMMHQCINDAFMKSAFCILYQTSSHTLLSEIDRRHLI